MKAKIIRSFAAGIMLASAVSGAVYFFGPSKGEDSQKTKIAHPTDEEMKESLTSDGYIVLTEDEWVAELAAVEAAKQEEAKQAEQETDKKEEQKEQSEEVKEVVVYRTVLNVASGMTSIDVGNALVKGKIIDNAKAFFDEVEKRGLANELRPGTFELDSKMSMDQVINTIF